MDLDNYKSLNCMFVNSQTKLFLNLAPAQIAHSKHNFYLTLSSPCMGLRPQALGNPILPKGCESRVKGKEERHAASLGKGGHGGRI